MATFFKMFLGVLLVIFLFACASAPRNYVPSITEKNYPPLGKIVTAEIGEEMLVQGVLVTRKVMETSLESNIWAYTITPGVFRKTGEDMGYEYYSPTIDADSGTIRPLLKGPDYTATIRLDRRTKETCIMRPTDATVCGALIYNFSDVSFSHPQNFQQTLLYSGKKSSIISVSYREYKDEMARPAYYNDVDYDLNESNIIGYKGARIEVINANNTQITYKLVAGFK